MVLRKHSAEGRTPDAVEVVSRPVRGRALGISSAVSKPRITSDLRAPPRELAAVSAR